MEPSQTSKLLLCSCTGAATQTVSGHLREAQVAETAAVVAEKGREVTKKGWNILKGAYATVASSVEQVARENGYKVDLGAPNLSLQRSLWLEP
jgi:hypothetical protein